MSYSRDLVAPAASDGWLAAWATRRQLAAIVLPGLVMAMLLVPLLFGEVPPFGDYPNHVAGAEILNALPADPIWSLYFEQHFRPVPNLGFDLVVLPLSHWLGPLTAGRVFIGLTLAGTIWGVVNFHRAWFGGTSAWPYVAALFAYNQLVLAGFLNCALGAGLLLGFAGIMWRLRERGMAIRLPVAALLALALYAVHLSAYGLFCLLCAALEVRSLAPSRRGDRRLSGALARASGVALALSPPGLLLLATTDFGASVAATAAGSPLASAMGVLSRRMAEFPRLALVGYSLWLNVAVAVFVAGMLAAGLAARRTRLSWPPLLVAALLLVGYFLIPDAGLYHTDEIYLRLPAIIGLLAIAGTDFLPAPRLQTLWLGVGGMLLALQSTDMAGNLHAYNADVAEFRAAFATVPAGGKLFSVRPDALPGTIAKTADAPAHHFYFGSLMTLHQLQMLMAAERHVFMPNYFTHPDKHLLGVRPEFRPFSNPDGGVPEFWSTVMHNHPASAERNSSDNAPARSPSGDWLDHFDYLSVLYPSLIPDAAADPALTPVYRGHWIAIYRIRRPNEPASGGA